MAHKGINPTFTLGQLLYTDAQGHKWGPIACPLHGTSEPDVATGVGFQPSCGGCVQTASDTVAHINQVSASAVAVP